VACTSRGVCAGILLCDTQRKAADALVECAGKALHLPEDAARTLATRGELVLGDAARARVLCDRAVEQLIQFASGQPIDLGVPIDLSAHTPFRQAVLREVARLRRGETATYGEIARRTGRPKAARAVGQTMATNVLAPFVPCHRVLGSGGHLHGFGGGLPAKAAMLRAEGVAVRADNQRLDVEEKAGR